MPWSCRQYKPGDFLAITPLNWDEIINEDDNDENWVDPGVLSGRRSHSGDGNDNEEDKGEEDTQGGERETGKRKGAKSGKGKQKATEDRKGSVTGVYTLSNSTKYPLILS